MYVLVVTAHVRSFFLGLSSSHCFDFDLFLLHAAFLSDDSLVGLATLNFLRISTVTTSEFMLSARGCSLFGQLILR